MKRILIMCMVLLIMQSCADFCTAQSLYPFADPPRVITTAVDTLVATGKDLVKYELSITNYSTTDTLLWRTDNTATWNWLMPLKGDTRKTIYMKKLFRKAKSGSGLKCEAYGN